MNRILVLICLVSCATLEIETLQSFYITRKIRSNLEPVKSEPVPSEVNNKPTISLFYESDESTVKNNKSEEVSSFKGNFKIYSNTSNIKSTTTEYASTSTERVTVTNRSENVMLAESNMIPTYDMGPGFHSDDEDIRSDSRNYYYSWPYLYHTPYEYDKVKYDIEVQKAKDKRFIETKIQRVIPVHEDIDDIPNSYIYPGPEYMYNTYNTYNNDNPIFGNKPFFSYILGDYFDKSYDNDDPLTFKDSSWGKEFDKESLYQNMDNYDKELKQLEDEYPNHFEENFLDTLTDSKSDHNNQQIAIDNKKYSNNHEFDAIIRGNDYQRGYENGKKLYGKYLKDFKDFTDTFANKFGSKDQLKISKYSTKNNADKGENKKGLREVFHNDKNQERTESFEDDNKSSKSEELGASRIGTGDSGAYLRSKAAASLGHVGHFNNGAEDRRSVA